MLTTETAIVTGVSQGIGASLVTRFLEMGFNVVGNSRAISDSTNLTPSPQLALVDGDIADSATAQKMEVLQLCSHSVIDLPDDAPSLFGLRSIQMAAIRTGSHPACDRLVCALSSPTGMWKSS